MLSAYYRELPTTLEPSRILYINSLLREMGHQIARLPEPWPSSDRQDIEALKEYSMMPISFQDSTVKQPLVILSSAKSRNEWFIADRIHLQRSFSGRVALLAMDVLDVESPDCKKLFDALDCNGRRLSRVAVPRIQGKHREDRGLSARMKAIARYMDRYVVAFFTGSPTDTHSVTAVFQKQAATKSGA